MNISKHLRVAILAAGFAASGYAFAADESKVPQNFDDQQLQSEGKPRGFEQDEQKFPSISEVLKKHNHHDKVIVRGRLTKFIGGDKYQLTDGNNDNIIVELDEEKDWSYLAKDMPIVVYAEVDNDHMTKILDVKKARPDRGAMFGRNGGPGPHDHGFHGPRYGNCPVCPTNEAATPSISEVSK